MKATQWEFANRAIVFGFIFGVSFPLYSVDPMNISEWLANGASAKWHLNADMVVRLIFVVGALLVAAAALVRSWASSYLHAGVVYASAVKTETLVADGPYRFVRNPLYFGNVLMAIGMGLLMSRLGFCVVILLMLLFCYRLIFREEEELRASQGESYARYWAAVPRILPSPRAMIPASANLPRWSAGVQAELWCWGFALAVLVFALTLKQVYFFTILGVSFVFFVVNSHWLAKRANSHS